MCFSFFFSVLATMIFIWKLVEFFFYFLIFNIYLVYIFIGSFYPTKNRRSGKILVRFNRKRNFSNCTIWIKHSVFFFFIIAFCQYYLMIVPQSIWATLICKFYFKANYWLENRFYCKNIRSIDFNWSLVIINFCSNNFYLI